MASSAWAEVLSFKCTGSGQLTIITTGGGVQYLEQSRGLISITINTWKDEVSISGTTSQYSERGNEIVFKKEFIISGAVVHKLDYKFDKVTGTLRVNKTWPNPMNDEEGGLKDQTWMTDYTCKKVDPLF